MQSDDLKRMALLALEEVAEQAGDGPVPRTRLLRFALAFLYRAAGGGERWPFDDFWMAATAEPPAHSTAAGAAIGRAQTTNACLNAIYRAVGVERPDAALTPGGSGRGPGRGGKAPTDNKG